MRATTSTAGILRPAQVRQRVDLRRYAVAADVGRYVERCWAVHWDLPGPEPYPVELVPHPCVNLTVIGGAGAEVHGVGTRRSTYPLAGSGWVFGVKFRPGGFGAYTGTAAARLTGRSVPAGSVFGPVADDLAAAVQAAPGDARRVRLVEEFLRDHLPTREDPGYALVLRVVAGMLADRTATRVDQVARRHAVSVRTLQRLFHQYVGVGPKWVIRRYRMHDGAERLASGTVTDPAALAVELGWFDQAHFTRDFTAVIGVSPGEYAAACAAAGDREPLALLPG